MAGQMRRHGIDQEWFWTLLCGGSADYADWCIWQVFGLVALLIGGFWLLMQLAKWKLAPRDERQSPEPLALAIALVIVIGGLVILGSNAISAEPQETIPEGTPPVDGAG